VSILPDCICCGKCLAAISLSLCERENLPRQKLASTARQLAKMLCLSAVLICPGCRWLTAGGPYDRAAGWGGGGEAESPISAGDNSADRAVFARDVVQDDQHRGHSVWIRAIRRPLRWRNPAVEEILARPPQMQPDLHALLRDRNPIVAANAAIYLGRSGDRAGAEQLAAVVSNPSFRLPMRCAAVEALSELSGPKTIESLRALVDRYGDPTPQGASTYNGNLHAELIGGLARHVEVCEDARFRDALQSRSAAVRSAALRAWSSARPGTLPDEAVRLCDDRDRDVRAAALHAMARHRHGDAHSRLCTALRDHDVQVRIEATGALGELDTAQARQTLEQLLEDPAERIRAEAVAALAGLGVEQAVLRSAGDESWRVREAVARAICTYPDQDGAAVAEKLAGDSSSRVVQAAIESVADWPLERAGPVLLAAMGGSTYQSSKAAAEQLAARWPAAAEFPATGTTQQRRDALEKLRAEFRQLADQPGTVPIFAQRKWDCPPNETNNRPGTDPIFAERKWDCPPDDTDNHEQLDRVAVLVDRQDVRGLLDLGPPVVDALELLVFDRHRALPEVIYREVLPRFDASFVALDHLQTSEPALRRATVKELAGAASERPLRPLAVDRLYRLVEGESDQIVWQDVLDVVAGDGSEPAARLAYAAIGHPSPEVRRRACEHLAANPDPQHAKVLIPSLQDASHSVVVAAVRALAAGGRLDDTRPLQQLLVVTNEQIRLETASALLRLGDPAGAAELERLAYSADGKLRQQVAAAMGDSADPRFTAALIRMLDDQVTVARAALESLPEVVGKDISLPDAGPPPTTTERFQHWKRWHAEQPIIGTRSMGETDRQ